MTYNYTVCRQSAFLFEAPMKESPVTDQLLFGSRVRILEKMRGGFAGVETSYGYQGYIHTSDIEIAKSCPAMEKCTITSGFADVLYVPEYKYTPIFTLLRGSEIDALYSEKEENERFVPIMLCGTQGYVRREQVEKNSILYAFDSENLKRQQIVKTAKSYLGTQYRWGGKSSDGIDCSGLCFMAYTLCGLSLWRDSTADKRFVYEISPQSLLPCDIVYFDGHVVMYLGNSEYIHSSATLGKVSINSFDENSKIFYPRLRLRDAVMCARSVKFKM